MKTRSTKRAGSKARRRVSAAILHRQEGIGLIAGLLVMMLISVLGAAMLMAGMADLGVSANYRSSKVAFYEADTGLQQSLIDLVATNTWAGQTVDRSTLPLKLVDPFPSTVTINGQNIVLDTDGGGNVMPGWYDYGSIVNFGDGTYQRLIFLPPTSTQLANAKGSKLWVDMPVRSRGRSGGAEPGDQTLQATSRAMVFRYSVWDNAIFAGSGQAGQLINGNVEVHGSVHVVGDPNNPTTLDWSGGTSILNNYRGAADTSHWGADAGKLPPLPLIDVNGEMVQTLDAELRLKNGDILLGGGSTMGEADVGGNFYKEQLDGFYVDGDVNVSSSGASINADARGPYDISEDIAFPTLDDPFVDPRTGTPWPTHRDYLNNGLTIPYSEISSNTPAFALTDGTNSIAWDPATKTLTVDGVIRVDGNLQFGRNGNKDRINYSGTGTMYATDDIAINWDIMPVGGYLDDSQPMVHNLGLVADDDVTIAAGGGATQLQMMAAVYAEDDISVSKQTRVAGAMVGSYFNLGNNVPEVWQVPKLAGLLPPGMPGSAPLLFVIKAEQVGWTHIR